MGCARNGIQPKVILLLTSLLFSFFYLFVCSPGPETPTEAFTSICISSTCCKRHPCQKDRAEIQTRHNQHFPGLQTNRSEGRCKNKAAIQQETELSFFFFHQWHLTLKGRYENLYKGKWASESVWLLILFLHTDFQNCLFDFSIVFLHGFSGIHNISQPTQWELLL